MKKVALHNLGCKVNAYETEVIRQLLTENGYKIVPFDAKADIYIVNTCTVTNIADRKSRQMLHKAKKQNPLSLVIAMGCYAQTGTKQALEDECIDLIIGNNKKNELINILNSYESCPASKTMDDTTIIDIGAVSNYESMQLKKMEEHTRAYIKIQDGCNQFCSYCIIPYARGRIRSRSAEDITAEVKGLVENGYKEIVLTGIHISSYGAEQKEKKNLLWLIQQLHAIKGIERIRLGSLEPRIITEEFVQALTLLPKLCHHFHLSLQSGSDTVLKRMNRHYTCSEYERNILILRKYFQNPAITTDIITGFPGETQEEFEETCRFVEAIQFYETHIFKYSKRNGTPAASMDEQIPETIKAKRSSRLLALHREQSQKYRSLFIGQPVEVLWEEEMIINDTTYLTGYTREYIKIAVITDKSDLGQIQTGRVKSFLTEDILEFSC